jgi:hypothetical protein
MRAHRAVVLMLFAARLVSSAVTAREGATDKVPLDVFLGFLDMQGRQQCEEYREVAKAATGEREKLKADITVKLQCECMPAQLATLTGKSDLSKEVTKDEALALVTPLHERCAALGMREFLVSSCPIVETPDPGIKDQKAYCACVAGQVEKLSDAEFITAAMAVQTDYDARAPARKEGKPEPPKRTGTLPEFENLCRAEQGVPPD